MQPQATASDGAEPLWVVQAGEAAEYDDGFGGMGGWSLTHFSLRIRSISCAACYLSGGRAAILDSASS